VKSHISRACGSSGYKKLAAEHLGISLDYLRKCIKLGKPCKGYTFISSSENE